MRRYFCNAPEPFLLLTGKMRLSEADDVLTTQMMTVTGLLHGFQCPFMTFPTSAPHPPLFCETRPTFTSWFSSMSQARLYGLLSSSSLYFMVCLSLTRSFVHLKSPDFQDPQNNMKFAQGKKKNASQHLHGSFHVVARGSHTPKSVDAAT